MNKFAPKQIIPTNTFQPTQEQVVNKDIIKSGKDVKIVAGAGSGKSSSLRYIANELSDKKILVLCFNAANAKESNEHPDRPFNIYYATTHSIAYREIICPLMRKKLAFLDFNDLKEFNLDSFIPLYNKDKTDNLSSTQRPDYSNKLHRAFLDIVVYFCRSDKTSIDNFGRYYLTKMFIEDVVGEEPPLTEAVIKSLVDKLELYWSNLIDKNHQAKINHDVYLKIFQLAEIDIDFFYDKDTGQYIEIDILALDEAQDSIPVVEDIFSKQKLQRVIVGDPMQQLYEWRGAGKAMDNFTDFSLGYLTQSFRFNQHIADIANRILANAGSTMVLTGSSKQTEIKTQAHLCRTNASVISAIFNYVGTNLKVYTSIDFKDTFSKLFHIQACYFNEKPRYPNKELSFIKDKASLEEALVYSDELTRLLKLKEKLTSGGGNLYSAKQAIESLIVKDISKADIVISSIHSSKGLEWDEVTIDEDFLIPFENETIEDMLERLWETLSLCCLLYVGVTRAKVKVNLPIYLESLLSVTPILPNITLDNLPIQLNNYVVYYLYSFSNELLFIGVTKNLENRFKQHYRVDKWMVEVNRQSTKIDGYSNRMDAYKARKSALLDDQPKYSEIYVSEAG